MDNIISLNAAVREHNINYSNFIYGLNRSNIELDRKILVGLAINEPFSFKAVVDEIKLNHKVLQKPPEKIDYMEALARGMIVEGRRVVHLKEEAVLRTPEYVRPLD